MNDQTSEPSIEIIHPFRIETIFYQKIFFERPERFDDDFQFALQTELALGFPEEGNRYHLHLRTASTDETRNHLNVEIIQVGIFDYLGEGDPSDDSIVGFVNDFLLVAMTSRLIQFVGVMTSQMGRSPIWLPTPRAFGLDLTTLLNFKHLHQEGLNL
jgi:hypothetical protein